MRRFLSFCVLLGLLAAPAFAAVPIEDVSFDNPEHEERYRELTQELRCPKCLNSNLAGSDAPIAASMRAKIRDQLEEGLSDAEIKDFWVARYGDFVLYRPPLKAGTVLLWFGPLLLLIAGFYMLWRLQSAARNTGTEAALSAEEMQKLQSLLRDDKDAQ